MRLDQLVQLSLGRCTVDLEEAVAPRQLLLGGVFEVGKASLHDRLVSDERAAILRAAAQQCTAATRRLRPTASIKAAYRLT